MFASFLKQSPNPVAPAGGIAALAAFFRRLIPALGRRSSADGALEHLSSLPLTAHASLTLVRFNEQTLLLGVTPQGVTVLANGNRGPGRRKTTRRKTAGNVEGRVGAEAVVQ